MEELTPILVLKAYLLGVFPMARSANEEEVVWVCPEKRGIIPLDTFHISRTTKKIIKKHTFEIKFNQNFKQVINLCAAKTNKRPDTWINAPIKNIYIDLFDMGFAHSVECFLDGKMVGGLYGVSLGGAFFGESMFSRADNASKVALCYLIARLKACGFTLLDAQFLTTHLEQFGSIEISKEDYLENLNQATQIQASFNNCSFDAVEQVMHNMLYNNANHNA
ncbi:MAG: leucyl/phenylalanyl-tRNA--protein transferase [Alphaproteobacteria bacterium]